MFSWIYQELILKETITLCTSTVNVNSIYSRTQTHSTLSVTTFVVWLVLQDIGLLGHKIQI
jgi:hypothetical protein